MIRYWRIEWLKNKGNRTLWIMMLLMFIALPGMVFVGNEVKELPSTLPGKDLMVTFPHVWDFLAYNGNWQSFFFLGFLTIYLITSEYNYGTVKQNIIQGYSRREYFLGKVLFLGSMIGVTFLYFVLLGLWSGFTETDMTSAEVSIWGNDWIIGRYLLMTIAYCAFAMLIAFSVRKTGPALLLYFAYILFLEPVLRWLFHRNLFQGESQYFYPMNAVEDLCPMPLYKILPEFIDVEQTGIHILTPTESTTASLIYTALFVFLAFRIFLKRDL